jgi:hypothetical protein
MSNVTRLRIGGRQKGTPNKATADLREAAKAYTHEALATLVTVMRTGKSDQIRMQAAIAILDRGHGKPNRAETWQDVRERARVEKLDDPLREYREREAREAARSAVELRPPAPKWPPAGSS